MLLSLFPLLHPTSLARYVVYGHILLEYIMRVYEYHDAVRDVLEVLTRQQALAVDNGNFRQETTTGG